MADQDAGGAPVRDLELVVLVDAAGTPIGAAEKLSAHQPPGRLHAAFSVFLFDPDGRVLLQRRADAKHHFAGRWSNACCSHPRPGEELLAAGRRRLGEELGLDAALTAAGRFTYRAADPVSGLVEHELDHVLVGVTEDDPSPDPDEVGDWARVDLLSLHSRLGREPDRFTPWLAPALDLAEVVLRERWQP